MKQFVRLPAIIFCFFFAVPVGLCDSPKGSRTYRLSVDDAIRLAFKNNKFIQIQEEELKIARANILSKFGRFLPTLSSNAGYTYNNAVMPSIFTDTKKDPGVFTGYQNDNTAGLSLNQTIYSGGADRASFKQAQLGLTVQEETLRLQKQDVVFEAKRLYYGLLLAYETQRIALELVHQAWSHYKSVKDMFSQGTASKFDLLQSKVEVSTLIPQFIEARNAVDTIAADLKKLLFLKMQDVIIVKERLFYEPLEPDEEALVREASLGRPEMRLRLLGIDIEKWQMEVARAQGRPQLQAGLDYGFRSNDPADMINSRHNIWSAGFSLSLPIFDAFSTKAKVQEARARYAQARLSKENMDEQIAVDVKKGCLDLKRAHAIIAASKDEIVEAKEALRIAEVSYENGEATNLDVLDSMVSLSQVQKNYAQAMYDHLMARAFLDRSVGRDHAPEGKK